MANNRDRYAEAIALCDHITLKGKNMIYTSENGHMFSVVNKDNEIGIRFSKERQEELIETLQSDQFYSHGAKMRWYVLIPEHMAIDKIAELLNESRKYILTLKPK